MVLEQFEFHVQKKNLPKILHIIQTVSKIGHRPRCKTYWYKTAGKENRSKYVWLWFGSEFLDTTPKAQSIKEKKIIIQENIKRENGNFWVKNSVKYYLN